MKIFCLNCKRETNHSLISEKVEHYIYPFESDVENEIDYGGIPPLEEYRKYQIIKCDGCDVYSFRDFSEIPNIMTLHKGKYDPNGVQTDENIYPLRKIKYRDIKTYRILPKKIETIYRESIDAFNNGIYILCAVGLRAIIEGICKDKNIQVKSLPQKIKKMTENGFISSTLSTTLIEQKILGDTAIHQLERPLEYELDIYIDIIEHLINDVYEINKIKELIINSKTYKMKNK